MRGYNKKFQSARLEANETNTDLVHTSTGKKPVTKKIKKYSRLNQESRNVNMAQNVIDFIHFK